MQTVLSALKDSVSWEKVSLSSPETETEMAIKAMCNVTGGLEFRANVQLHTETVRKTLRERRHQISCQFLTLVGNTSMTRRRNALCFTDTDTANQAVAALTALKREPS